MENLAVSPASRRCETALLFYGIDWNGWYIFNRVDTPLVLAVFEEIMRSVFYSICKIRNTMDRFE